MLKIRSRSMGLLLMLVGLAGCSDSGSDKRAGAETDAFEEPISIYVVNYPLKYFAERIGGPHVAVEFPAPSDVDPAFWSPAAETIVAYQNADVILLNGADYAKWTAKVSLPRSRIVVTSGEFGDRFIVTEGAVTHSHGPGGDHAHTGTAFTTWIDFDQAAKQARAIRDALTSRWPDKEDIWEDGYEALEKDLMTLDAGLQNAVAGKQSQPMAASHPVYQYLERRYALNISNVMWEPDAAPSERQWQEFSRLVETRHIKWMIWEGDPLPASVKHLEEMGVKGVVFDPCGNVPEVGDFMSVMKTNIESLKAAYH